MRTFILAALLLMGCAGQAQQPKEQAKAPEQQEAAAREKMVAKQNLEVATLGAGCFWCVEAVFQELKGVHKVVSGYSGGHVENPTYEQVCSKKSGHAEVVQVHFDPAVISYDDILTVFWHVHDPTTLNRQGNDRGPQYRSAIYYHNDKQKQTAERSKKDTDASGLWDDPIVTEVTAFTKFYSAESYHQDYYSNNPNQPYCSLVIAPKMRKFRKEFKDKLRK